MVSSDVVGHTSVFYVRELIIYLDMFLHVLVAKFACRGKAEWQSAVVLVGT